ncbi:hypothetical protein NMG60_11033871 [Bertholletia excelsa]
MADPQPRPQPSPSLNDATKDNGSPIPIDIVSEEEMALIESALASAVPSSSSSFLFSSLSPTWFQRNARSIRSITVLSKRPFSTETGPLGDIEDFGGTQKRNRLTESFLHRFRRNTGLFVTDITKAEWCEKKVEFLLFGRSEPTKAMKAGIARHAALEEEVVKRVKVRVKTREDVWALKLTNFIIGANQLQFDGLTRELPLLGFVDGVWMVGIVDEIRMPVTETEKSPERNPILVDTKTRVQPLLPSEAQRRNGRLQLMCYKSLWDNLVAGKILTEKFFDFFSLNRNCILSEDIRQNTAKSGFPSETLDDLMRYFQNTCCTLPPAHDQLLLRYELQEDHSLLSEDQFAYDSNWLKDQIQCSLEFWLGKREAKYVSEEETWKCKFCQFASLCPINTDFNSKSR